MAALEEADQIFRRLRDNHSRVGIPLSTSPPQVCVCVCVWCVCVCVCVVWCVCVCGVWCVQGVVIQRREKRPQVVASADDDREEEVLLTSVAQFLSHTHIIYFSYRNVEFHPMLFRQHAACPYREYPTLSKVYHTVLL